MGGVGLAVTMGGEAGRADTGGAHFAHGHVPAISHVVGRPVTLMLGVACELAIDGGP